MAADLEATGPSARSPSLLLGRLSSAKVLVLGCSGLGAEVRTTMTLEIPVLGTLPERVHVVAGAIAISRECLARPRAAHPVPPCLRRASAGGKEPGVGGRGQRHARRRPILPAP